MTQIKNCSRYMKADNRPVFNGPLDLKPFLGTWGNTKTDTQYLAQVQLQERDGALWLRCFGANDGPPLDWGEAETRPYLAGTSNRVGGFHACYLLDGIETHMVANQKLGILVIQSYTRYLDGSGRGPHFAREFFHQ